MKKEEARLGSALEWIASLVLLCDGDLAELLAVSEHDARHLRGELTRRGWVETVTPHSDGVRARPFALLRDDARMPFADWIGVEHAELHTAWPVGRTAALERIARHEVVQGLNRLLALLASQLRASGDGWLAGARSLPLALPRDQRWWPPGVEAHFEVRDGDERGTAFVAWDRAGAPDIHRRSRVRQWFRWAEDRADQANVGPVLVACAGDRELRVWEEAVRQQRHRAGRTLLDVLLVPVADVLRAGPLHARWRAPGTADGCSIMHWLDWKTAPAGRASSGALPSVTQLGPTLRARLAGGGLTLRGEAPLRERVASRSLMLDPAGRFALEWIARHPWLTSRQLSVVFNDPEPAVFRRLDGLMRGGIARSVRAPELEADLWIATDLGLHVLAAADQVTPSRYREGGAVAAPPDAEGRPGEVGLPRTFAHELGVNRAFVALAETARRTGGRLALWRNEAESLHVFGIRGKHRIRPDGSGVLEQDGHAMPFLVEYERGTLSPAQIRSKVVAYARYYAVAAWDEYFDTAPLVLWVCTDYGAGRRVAIEVTAAGAALPTAIVGEPDAGDGVVDPNWLSRMRDGQPRMRGAGERPVPVSRARRGA